MSIDEKLSALFSLDILPFDASHHDESNELLNILLQSLDGEKMRFNVLEKIPSKHFWQVGVYLA